MADGKSNGMFSSANDALDINELASLNDEISDDLIEHLSNQLSGKVSQSQDDSQLFEEVAPPAQGADLEDAFIKKFKAKQQMRMNGGAENKSAEAIEQPVEQPVEKTAESVIAETPAQAEIVAEPVVQAPESEQLTQEQQPIEAQTKQTESQPESIQNEDDNDISKVSGGNITEKPLTQEMIEYNESLDYIDNNSKYSKYVIYIDPENREFFDSLTVKERKNLINRILHEQDSVTITRKNIGKAKLIITHIILAIIVTTLMIPLIYFFINASLEATINNYRNSQSMFEQLYRSNSKIKPSSY